MYVHQPMHAHTSLFLAQWAREWSSHSGREGYLQPQQCGFLLPKVNSLIAKARYLTCQKQKSLLNHLYIRPLPTQNQKHFILTGTDTYSGFRFAFVAWSVSASITSKHKDQISVRCPDTGYHITLPWTRDPFYGKGDVAMDTWDPLILLDTAPS